MKDPSISTIHYPFILGNLGLLLHVPGIMCLISIIICLIFKEHYAIIPLLAISLPLLILGQLLFHLFFRPRNNLWDAMITAAIGWLICSLIGGFPYFWIAKKLLVSGQYNTQEVLIFTKFINAAFESFSGFTSTGLTLLKKPSELPYILQWWRSFQAWIGGLGLIVFIISLIEPKKREYKLYFAETRSEQIGKNITQTTQKIWGIYSLHTGIIILLYTFAKMPLWEAINHGMTSLATGGFTITDQSFVNYSYSIQCIAIIAMILGCTSFTLHYHMIREGNFLMAWRSKQHRFLLFLLLLGAGMVILLNFFQTQKMPLLSCVFQWITSLSTCGFRSTDVVNITASIKLLLIFGMIIGGASGSTAGGIKIRRFYNLFSAILLRIKGITKDIEKTIITTIEKTTTKEREITEIDLPKSKRTARLYSASILFIIWIFLLTFSWFILLLIESPKYPLNALLDIASALSNVGLSAGVVQESLIFESKILFIILMWIGRLEIVPIIILIFSLFSSPLAKKKLHKNHKLHQFSPHNNQHTKKNSL